MAINLGNCIKKREKENNYTTTLLYYRKYNTQSGFIGLALFLLL